MLNVMKVVALVGQLLLSLHGEGHPLHVEHMDDRKRTPAAIVR